VDLGESFEQAALREAREEIGLAPTAVTPLGPLTPLDIHVSGFRLHPIVAMSAMRPDLEPADGEVERILEVPLERLMDPDSLEWHTMTRDHRTVRVPLFSTGGAAIWGATAMVIAEFLTMLGWEGPRTP
jgi:8-oxo-dGTP pyrophosphatase MutT (NUDIX family)